MQKSTHTPLYDLFREELIRMRQEAGLTQRELAKKVGREHSFVGRRELGDRRIDLVELFWIAKACGQDPEEVARRLMGAFGRERGRLPLRSRSR